jgi:hypothetical protein
MTGVIEDDPEGLVYAKLGNQFIIPSLSSNKPAAPNRSLQQKLNAAIAESLGANNILSTTEQAMIPSTMPKAERRPFRM